MFGVKVPLTVLTLPRWWVSRNQTNFFTTNKKINNFSPRAMLPRGVIDMKKIHVFCTDNSVRYCRITATIRGKNWPHTATPRRMIRAI